MSYEDTLEKISKIMESSSAAEPSTVNRVVGGSNPPSSANEDPPRYFVSMYTDGPATRWNIIDRQTQEWIRRFASEWEAKDYAAKLNGDPVGQALRGALAATDELVILANDYGSRTKICDNPTVIDRILANIQLVASLVEATNQRPTFRIVKT